MVLSIQDSANILKWLITEHTYPKIFVLYNIACITPADGDFQYVPM